ncbi:MAG: BamA/TamA family outer membrane protein [Armatimonadetes bacterium]|nr:BamA/TamA family outer membrane protein [Armatimonadota bacterium]
MRIRMRRWLLCCWIALNALMIAGALAAQEQPPQAPSKTVTEVIIEGLQNINRETVMGVVSTKVGEELVSEKVRNDEAAINALGYFDSVVSRTEETSGGVRVIFTLVEKPVIREIVLTGNTVFPTDALLGLMRTKTGQVMNPENISRDLDAIAKHYRDNEYAVIILDLQFEDGVLKIPLTEVTVESVDITGLKRTRPVVVRRQLRTRPGDVVNFKKIREDITRLANLDLFEAPIEPTLPEGSDIGKVKLAIPLKEKKTGQISLGFGYSSRDRLVGRAEYAENNFRGMAQQLSLMYEIGGLSNRSSYELSFYEPWLDSRKTSMTVSLFDKVIYRFASGVVVNNNITDNETRYTEQRRGANLFFSRPINASETTDVGVGLRTEEVRTNELSGYTPPPNYIRQDGRINALNFRYNNDTRDYRLDPARGGRSIYTLEFGQASLQDPFGRMSFTKGNIDLRRYFSRGKRVRYSDPKRVIATRLLLGGASGKLPFFEQFFMGGAESLRGYQEDRFWGDKVMLFTTEYRHPFGDRLQGVLFFDYGGAWGGQYTDLNSQGSFKQSKDFQGHSGVGLGIRVATPIGLIRLDYGIGDEGSRTHFSIGQVF